MNVAQSRILRRAGLTTVLGLAAVLLSGCSIDSEVLRFGFPSGITPQSTRIRELWTWSVVAALVMGIIVWALIFWVVIFHRKKKDSPEFPRQTAYNVPLELFYTAVPFVIIAVLFYFTVVVQNYVGDKQSDPDVTVDVTAFQWNWKFGYQTIDLKDGVVKYEGTDLEAQAAAEAAASPPEGEAQGSEDGEIVPGAIHGVSPQDLSYLHYNKIETVGTSDEIPVLVLPTGKRIEFVLASSDVIHGFWVPEFLFKRDVMPNPKENHSDNVFQISEIEREGSFVGRCTEMCGTYHAMMNFEVRAVSPDDFQQYIESRKPKSEGGKALTNAQALEAIGQSPVSTSTIPFTTDRTQKSESVADGN
ncbi:cytochrome C oxidase subunit II [Rhodococcus sp. 1163]|uniref:aa3-type cytochrome oxidase subunit II n=1 Tax=unclassified Rhodococcus (in: high G+C Gram-positive bacteria) TaxID=192944 RepID=UPI000A0311C7|nr:cytochrome c oxidase subunit II [Rhodococcus sp. 1163]ORI17011.1 cytochrome C oxidase subunit II [Rhodococcus sp. 1163]